MNATMMKEAIEAARHLLLDEANQLSLPSSYENYEKLPHRAKVAIRREVDRLRECAGVLSVIPDNLIKSC